MPQNNSPDSPAASAKIIVTRDSEDDVQTRQINVLLDGEQKAELMFGDSITISTPPGHHTLRVDNTWNHKDLALELAAGNDLRFVTKNTTGQFSRFLLIAFGAGPIYVSIEPASSAPKDHTTLGTAPPPRLSS
jgi:hypothetical protein